jgi:hypothetical protein
VTPADTHKQGHVTYGFGRRQVNYAQKIDPCLTHNISEHVLVRTLQTSLCL